MPCGSSSACASSTDVDDRPKYAVTQIDDVTDRRGETERLDALALRQARPH
jgi:hypothetical protein